MSSMLFGVTSCSQDEDLKMESDSKIIITESDITTRSANGDNGFGYYDIRYGDAVYHDVKLTPEQLEACRKATALGEPVEKVVTGYNRLSYRSTSGNDSYKLRVSGKYAENSGVIDGTYIARDIWVYQETTIPVTLGVVIPNNGYYTDFMKIGYDPNALVNPGLTCSLGGNKVTLQTGAVLLTHNAIGQEMNMTYPLNVSFAEWHFYYMSIL